MHPKHQPTSICRPGLKALSALAALILMLCSPFSAPIRALTVYEQTPIAAPGSDPIAISQSKLTGSKLTAGAVTLGTEEQLADTRANLNKAAQKYDIEGEVKEGFVEMIAWIGSSGTPRTALYKTLDAAGYTRTDYDTLKVDNSRITFFKLVNSHRGNETLFGMWAEDGKALLVAWGRVSAPGHSAASKETGKDAVQPKEKNTPAEETAHKPTRPAVDNGEAGDAITLRVDPKTSVLNVMGKKMPNIPTFPKATPKPDVVCGYVYDASGKPVKGAIIGVRSTAVGGFYSGASGKADAKGYYEVHAPWGVAHFYCAGAVIDYGEGLAALGLHPEDGETGDFVPTKGEVKNFVLLNYGIADRAGIQDNPRYPGNYYGGALSLGWRVDDGANTQQHELPPHSEIVLTLTPDGPLEDGSRGKTIVIRKQVGELSFDQLYINNIPIGTYKLTAKLANGRALHIKETGPNSGKSFGLEPKEGNGEVKLSFRPGSAKAEMAIAGHGNWERIDITLTMP